MDTRNITTIHWCNNPSCESKNFTLCLGKKLGYIAAFRLQDPLPEIIDLLSELLCLGLPVPQKILNEVISIAPNIKIDAETRAHLHFWLRAEIKNLSVGCVGYAE